MLVVICSSIEHYFIRWPTLSLTLAMVLYYEIHTLPKESSIEHISPTEPDRALLYFDNAAVGISEPFIYQIPI